jgi:hypothetical protein
MGTDTIVASVSNASGGSFSSNAVKVTWLHSSTLVSTPKLIPIPEGGKISLSATLTEDGTTPIVGRKVTETLGSGSASQSCTGVTDATGTATCSISPVTVPLGPQPITDSFTSDGSYASQTHDQHGLVFAYLGRGSFVVGDRSDAVGSSVNWWGSQWAGRNSLSGGSAPDSFKGFADSLSSTPPACGGSWTSDPGNSGRPPATVPSYMAVISAGSIRKSGSTISGNVMHIVIVKTDVGYADDPGHAGTGTVIAQLCP